MKDGLRYDLASAKRFYDAALGALGALGYGPGAEMGERVIYSAETGSLLVTKPPDGNRATFGNGVTIGLNALNPAAVDAFHQGAVSAGGRCEGPPGPRTAIPSSYGAYLRDPTGHKLLDWCVTAS